MLCTYNIQVWWLLFLLLFVPCIWHTNMCVCVHETFVVVPLKEGKKKRSVCSLSSLGEETDNL